MSIKNEKQKINQSIENVRLSQSKRPWPNWHAVFVHRSNLPPSLRFLSHLPLRACPNPVSSRMLQSLYHSVFYRMAARRGCSPGVSNFGSMLAEMILQKRLVVWLSIDWLICLSMIECRLIIWIFIYWLIDWSTHWSRLEMIDHGPYLRNISNTALHPDIPAQFLH